MPACTRFLLSTLVLVMAGCASQPPASSPPAAPPAPSATRSPSAPASGALPNYRCDNNVAFTVRFGDGTADIDAGPLGQEALLRDAGGLTPQQTVYSSTKLRAEFGLDPAGRGAKLNYATPAVETRCLRE